MKTLIIALVAFAGSVASADGFKCTTEDGTLKIAVFNQVQPLEGTRNAAIMVVSNPTLQKGNKTIATFDAPGLLDNRSTVYTADVDLRFKNSSRKGELIAGTKLGYIDSISLAVDYSYAQPLAAGALVDGSITIAKRNGEVYGLDVECERYLKR